MYPFPYPLEEVTLAQVADGAFQQAIRDAIQHCIIALDRPTAREIYRSLLRVIPAAPKEMQELYSPWMRTLSVLALTYLSPDEVEEVVSTNLIFAWSQGVDIIDELATRIDLEFDTTRGQLIDRIRGALLRNNEEFGGASFQLTTETQVHRGTLSRWITAYDEVAGGGRNDTVRLAEFLQTYTPTRQLTDLEKALLKDLLGMYDLMKPISLKEVQKAEIEELSAQKIKEELARRQAELAEQRKQASVVAPVVPPSPPATPSVPVAPPAPATSTPPSPPTPRVPRTFQSLKDLEVVDVNMIRDTGLTIPEFAEAIKQQVSVLAGEDGAAKAQVAALWRSSPLYHLYTEIGRESVVTNTTLELVMQNRKVERKPTLSKDEFSALADLSHSLS